jgi:hypothetical protein
VSTVISRGRGLGRGRHKIRARRVKGMPSSTFSAQANSKFAFGTSITLVQPIAEGEFEKEV